MSSESVDAVFQLLLAASEEGYIGEPVSQLQHALQAAYFAHKAGCDEETVLAALLHDVGHLCEKGAPKMDALGVMNHERLGALWLKDLGFSQKVCDLVEGHVSAKRYLTGKHPEYHDKLSDASKGTLVWQGGPFTPDEVTAFEKDPLGGLKLQMRHFDDLAKDPSLKVPDLESYREMIRDHLAQEAQKRVAESA
uniref:HD/PDEase domain-containing protein n=1 Tax=Chromera velia CCMP2878 TaxID=1169474 RepID=A0A0G4F0G2_9ALVE|eukprot:Cvel_14550.t1-p1 / transcript=Cvel_14550.t1 / gene=Cvel_14550 / organism=Chromera_velia_CCMP2878 / gene_product=Uncharacterized protein L432, putative / transcript_product=Uncharacterized protein L432, putative / location=Cvel_scaffold1040:15670-17197(+) / protein_length=193 / sequence_SO=supercontig / SO=protein_coding / is_pseudo=false